MTFFIDEDTFEATITIVRPTIDALLGEELVGSRRNIHIVVIDPDGNEYEKTIAHNRKENWAHPYDEIARRKAKMCQRTGKPSGEVLTRTPWLLKAGDPPFAGGIIEDGLVVAVSGLQSHFDEMLAWMIFNAIAALCTDAIVRIQADPNSPDFLGIS